jgi:hypothetical protein
MKMRGAGGGGGEQMKVRTLSTSKQVGGEPSASRLGQSTNIQKVEGSEVVCRSEKE